MFTPTSVPDGQAAHACALAVKRLCISQLHSLQCVDADLCTETVTFAKTDDRRGRSEGQQLITGWLQVAANSADALHLWWAMLDIMGIGEGTSKTHGAVEVEPLFDSLGSTFDNFQ